MSTHIHMHSVEELFNFFRLGQPVHHPLVAIVDFSQVCEADIGNTKISTDFYTLIYKTYNRNQVKYGRKLVDFTNGSLICLAPNQILEMDDDIEGSPQLSGWGLGFHPDLIRGTPLGDKMKIYTVLRQAVYHQKSLQQCGHCAGGKTAERIFRAGRPQRTRPADGQIPCGTGGLIAQLPE